jgi:predicted ATP-dependent protease
MAYHNLQSTNINISGTRTEVITIEQLETLTGQPRPVLRLRNPASNSNLSLIRRVLEFMKLDTNDAQNFSPTPQDTEKNTKHLDEYFARMENRIIGFREDIKIELTKMKPDQQAELIEFAKGAAQFLNDIVNFMRSLFNQALEMIKQGYKVDVKELDKIFAESLNNMDLAYNERLRQVHPELFHREANQRNPPFVQSEQLNHDVSHGNPDKATK